MIRVPKRLAVLMLGIGGIFGMRTPLEPEALAQTVVPPNPGGSDDPSRRQLITLPRELPYSKGRQKARHKDPPVK
jgi:hypothetical protein